MNTSVKHTHLQLCHAPSLLCLTSQQAIWNWEEYDVRKCEVESGQPANDWNWKISTGVSVRGKHFRVNLARRDLETTLKGLEIFCRKHNSLRHLHCLPASLGQDHRNAPAAEYSCFCHIHCFQQRPVFDLDEPILRDRSELVYQVEKDM